MRIGPESKPGMWALPNRYRDSSIIYILETANWTPKKSPTASVVPMNTYIRTVPMIATLTLYSTAITVLYTINCLQTFFHAMQMYKQLTINVRLILQVRDNFFFAGKTHNGAFRGVFEELETFLAP